jgi:glycosyltransferase involved in cell wall biosynthesis
MKIYIEFSDTKNPWGGGNQFLKNLKKFFIQKKLYTTSPKKSDIIIINSFENFRTVLALKKKFPSKKFVQRVDGITNLYNNFIDRRDLLTFFLNRNVSIATIFQSKWCEVINKKYGLERKKNEITIYNTPDPKIFYMKQRSISKIPKIISSGWSSNWNKGFETLYWLDNNINFSKFEYTYIGKTPIMFKNIKIIPPQKSKSLGNYLRKGDIYISASKKDACSNSIIEAKACGLKIIALNDGGNPELIDQKKYLYKNKNEIINKLYQIIKDKNYKNSITYDSEKRYLNFLKKINKLKINPVNFNNISMLIAYLLMLYVLTLSFLSKLFNLVKEIYLLKLKFKYF